MSSVDNSVTVTKFPRLQFFKRLDDMTKRLKNAQEVGSLKEVNSLLSQVETLIGGLGDDLGKEEDGSDDDGSGDEFDGSGDEEEEDDEESDDEEFDDGSGEETEEDGDELCSTEDVPDEKAEEIVPEKKSSLFDEDEWDILNEMSDSAFCKILDDCKLDNVERCLSEKTEKKEEEKKDDEGSDKEIGDGDEEIEASDEDQSEEVDEYQSEDQSEEVDDEQRLSNEASDELCSTAGTDEIDSRMGGLFDGHIPRPKYLPKSLTPEQSYKLERKRINLECKKLDIEHSMNYDDNRTKIKLMKLRVKMGTDKDKLFDYFTKHIDDLVGIIRDDEKFRMKLTERLP